MKKVISPKNREIAIAEAENLQNKPAVSCISCK